MKNSLIILILLTGSVLYGQSDSIERIAIYNKLVNKEIKQDEFSRIFSAWNQKMREINKYPEIPVDQSGQAHYSFIREFKDIDKSKIFTRTLEWLSITYGLVPSYLYSNSEDGRIIYKNSINLITGNTCTYTCITSIKNEKILIEFINIGYQTMSEGHYSGDMWIPDKTTEFGINQVFPVILKKYLEWDLNLNLMKTTNDFFNTETENLCRYIVKYDSIYKF
jgi:hypothetical protein